MSFRVRKTNLDPQIQLTNRDGKIDVCELDVN